MLNVLEVLPGIVSPADVLTMPPFGRSGRCARPGTFRRPSLARMTASAVQRLAGDWPNLGRNCGVKVILGCFLRRTEVKASRSQIEKD